MRYIFLLLLLGHALGNFYFRKKGAAEDETSRARESRLHMLIYAIAAAIVFFASMQISLPLVILWVLTVAAHIVIDTAVAWLAVMLPNDRLSQMMRKYRFFISQILHLIVLLVLAVGFNSRLQLYPWLVSVSLPPSFLVYVTGVVYLLNPVSFAITEFFLATGLAGNVGVPEDETQSSFVRAGSLIGMLERVLAFILITNNQYAAVGFLLAAKTVTRFKDLEKREVAEYYLIGTLLSITAAFLLAMACNLLAR